MFRLNVLKHDFLTYVTYEVFLIMDSEEKRTAAAAAAVIFIAAALKRRKRKTNRSVWVKPWLKRRRILGVTSTLLREFCIEDQFELQRV